MPTKLDYKDLCQIQNILITHLDDIERSDNCPKYIVERCHRLFGKIKGLIRAETPHLPFAPEWPLTYKWNPNTEQYEDRRQSDDRNQQGE